MTNVPIEGTAHTAAASDVLAYPCKRQDVRNPHATEANTHARTLPCHSIFDGQGVSSVPEVNLCINFCQE
jgi:hypothetical protein